MGLFDSANFNDPQTIGLLTLGANLLQAGGPSTKPISLGQGVSSGLLGAMQAVQQSQKAQREDEEQKMMTDYRKAQIGELSRKSKAADDLDNFFKSRLYGAPGAMPAADMDASVKALGQGASLGDVGPTTTNAARMDAIRPPQQSQNGAFPFNLNDIAYLKTKGVDLADVYKLATDPIKYEGGSTYKDRATGQERYIPKIGEGMTLGPDGSVSMAPNYADLQAEIEGKKVAAQERAKTPFQVVTMTPKGGGPQVMTLEQQLQLLGRGQPATASPAAAQPQQPTLSAAPGEWGQINANYQSSQADRDSDRMRFLLEEYAKEADPQNKAALGREIMRARQQTAGGQVAANAQPPQSNGLPGIALQSEAEKEAQVGAVKTKNAVDEALLKQYPEAAKQKQMALVRAQDAIGLIDKALVHPGLPTATGVSGTIDPRNYIRGTDAANFHVLLDQIKGGTFLQAFDQLRGAGQITEVEGKKGTDAIARLSTAQSTDEFKKALQDFRSVLDVGMQRLNATPDSVDIARGKIAGNAPPMPTTTAENFLPKLPTANKSNMGKTAIDHDTGKRYKSNGMQWVEVK